MSVAIGPSFSSELTAQGLIGLPFSWKDDGTFTFDEKMTSDQIAAVKAVLAAHDPKALPVVFSDRATAIAAVDAASKDPSPANLTAAFAALVKVL